jgi:hypothetical protein
MREVGHPSPADSGDMSAGGVVETPQEQRAQPYGGQNPWLSDQVLLNLSLWWVEATRPNTRDFATEVALAFDSLQQDLRRAGS